MRRKRLFALVEQLIDQVLFYTAVAGQEMGHKHLSKSRLGMKDADHFSLLHPRQLALGDPADGVFYIRKGKVKLVVASKQGKQAVVAILGEGEFFGEGCLNGQSLRLAMARAMTESDFEVRPAHPISYASKKEKPLAGLLDGNSEGEGLGGEHPVQSTNRYRCPKFLAR